MSAKAWTAEELDEMREELSACPEWTTNRWFATLAERDAQLKKERNAVDAFMTEWESVAGQLADYCIESDGLQSAIEAVRKSREP